MYVEIFSKTFPEYTERMAYMTEYASVWMNTRNCSLELLPKE